GGGVSLAGAEPGAAAAAVPATAAGGRCWSHCGSARPPGGAARAGAAPACRPHAVPRALPPPLQGSHRDDAAAGMRDEGPSAPPRDPPEQPGSSGTLPSIALGPSPASS
ncbi:hypothetical protein DV515_00019367, partial [Chloebia gouldiae]